MTVDDRTNLRRKLEALLEEADTLTAHPLPVTRHEVVTEDDRRAHEASLPAAMQAMAASLRNEMQTDDADLRTRDAHPPRQRPHGARPSPDPPDHVVVTFVTAWSALLVMAVRLRPLTRAGAGL
jgi:hypothetical protein